MFIDRAKIYVQEAMVVTVLPLSDVKSLSLEAVLQAAMVGVVVTSFS